MMDSQQRADLLAAALPDLQEAVELAGSATASAQERLQAVNTLAEALDELSPAWEDQGEALCQLIAFLDAAVFALPEQTGDEDAPAVVAVQELLALIEAHLRDPQAEDIREGIVELATSPLFDPPLDPADAQLWQLPLTAPSAPPESADTATPDDALREDVREILSILSLAIRDTRAEWQQSAEILSHADDPARRARAGQRMRDTFERFAEASGNADFTSFATLCGQLSAALAAMPADQPWPQPLLDRLETLPQRLLEYLSDPLATATREPLRDILTCEHWTQPLAASEADPLIGALASDLLNFEKEALLEHPSEVTEEDLVLTPSEDIDLAILASFRREGPELLEQLSTLIDTIVSGAADAETLHQAQRAFHTIKGSANICGIRAIAALSHPLEDLLEFLLVHEQAPGEALGATLVQAVDTLAILFDALNGLEPHDPQALRPVLQEVLDWIQRIDSAGVKALDSAANVPVSHAPVHVAGAPADTAVTAPQESCLQVPARVVDALLRLSGELTVALSQTTAQLQEIGATLRESDGLDQRNLKLVNSLERLVDLRGALPAHPGAAEALFSHLHLDQYDEMAIQARQLSEGITDAREFSRTFATTLQRIDDLHQHQSELTRELRELVMETRLVPVGSIQSRLQRVIRQTCRETGKQAQLHLEGETIEVDGQVLERLLPALLHILRNSIDHGIESPQQREAAGKNPVGQVHIRFAPLGDQIELTVSDDGRGLDLERIRTKAIDVGLLTPQDQPSGHELAQLTLAPGFSTREQVTQISGRGIGMDVVATAIRSLNGTLRIDSEPGQGYHCTVRVPVSLLTLYCLLVRCQDQRLAVPANAVRRAVLTREGSVQENVGAWSFTHEGTTCPLHSLPRLLGQEEDDATLNSGVMLLVPTPGGEQAVRVDTLLDSRDLLIQRPGELAPRVPALIATSILRDGSIVPIMELPVLLRQIAGRDLSALAPARLSMPRLPSILIVDDSLSMRRALGQLVSDAGYQARLAHDGLEALHLMEEETVDAVLVDMEMPQMNGLELTSHLRRTPATTHLPIAMITSRSTDRYRQEALQAGVDQYFIKPYREEAILDFLHQALATDVRPPEVAHA